jgi:hypothetical protein
LSVVMPIKFSFFTRNKTGAKKGDAPAKESAPAKTEAKPSKAEPKEPKLPGVDALIERKTPNDQVGVVVHPGFPDRAVVKFCKEGTPAAKVGVFSPGDEICAQLAIKPWPLDLHGGGGLACLV